MANEFIKPNQIRPAITGEIADPDIYNQNIAGQSKDSVVGIDENGIYKDFDVGDEAITTNGSLVQCVRFRNEALLKIHDNAGSLIKTLNLTNASFTDTIYFEASGTWTNPLAPGQRGYLFIQGWGGGGSGRGSVGGANRGGGGGSYKSHFMPIDDTFPNQTVIVGAGGVNNGGGNGAASSFGVYLIAYGGAGGNGNQAGAGGGWLSNSTSNINDVASGEGVATAGLVSYYIGGSGGIVISGSGAAGASSVYGGGGGASVQAGAAGGFSKYGGNGGSNSTVSAERNGQIPGGGGAGGNNGRGLGARGRVIVNCFGF